MAATRPGKVRIGVSEPMEFIQRLVVDTQLGTSGIQYSPVATFGTTAVELYSKLIDPGYSLNLKEFEVAFTQKFTGLNAAYVASINYYWQARSEAPIPSGGFPCLFYGSYCNVSGTYEKAVGTAGSAVGDTSEDTFSGFISVGTIPYAPVRVKLTAIGLRAAICQGKVKNSSFVRFVGNVIPGV